MNNVWGVVRNVSLQFAAFVAAMCIDVIDTHVSAAVSSPTHGWQQGAPAGVGLDERVLVAFDADLAAAKYGLVDSFQVFRCGEEVFHRKYDHDYRNIYATQAKIKGPLNARLS